MDPNRPDHTTTLTELDGRVADLRAKLASVGAAASARSPHDAHARKSAPPRPAEELRDEEERLALLVFHTLDGDQARLLHFVHALGHLQAAPRPDEPAFARDSDPEPTARAIREDEPRHRHV